MELGIGLEDVSANLSIKDLGTRTDTRDLAFSLHRLLNIPRGKINPYLEITVDYDAAWEVFVHTTVAPGCMVGANAARAVAAGIENAQGPIISMDRNQIMVNIVVVQIHQDTFMSTTYSSHQTVDSIATQEIAMDDSVAWEISAIAAATSELDTSCLAATRQKRKNAAATYVDEEDITAARQRKKDAAASYIYKRCFCLFSPSCHCLGY
ncbi:hypothetical protein ACH5RR_036914 [Cinchona calisaya]|uniref:Uncharacterized protein n=1 Tax=Cinchona calisaya TaxID=153742 RepID=A0ABD2Y9H7_9GENT